MRRDKKTYRAGVVGLGFIGSEAEERHLNYPGRILYPHGHAAAFSASPRVELVAGADRSPQRLKAFSERWGVDRLYTDFGEMLKEEGLDLVGIATPASHHKQGVLDAAAAGVKGILCEKPIATNLRDADQMIEACDRAGAKLAINTWRRWEPYYLRARRLVRDGAIGTLRSLVGHWSGMLLGTGTHGFDLLNFFAESEVDWLVGHLDDPASTIDPGGDTYIAYRNGVRAMVNGRSGTSAHFEVEVFGSTGRIRIGNMEAALWKEVPEGGRRLLAQLPFPQSGPMTAPMLTGVEELVRCVESGEEPSSGGREGRLALAMALATYESSVRGNLKIPFPYQNETVDIPTFEKLPPDVPPETVTHPSSRSNDQGQGGKGVQPVPIVRRSRSTPGV